MTASRSSTLARNRMANERSLLSSARYSQVRSRRSMTSGRRVTSDATEPLKPTKMLGDVATKRSGRRRAAFHAIRAAMAASLTARTT